MSSKPTDTPLSITSSIAGIATLLFALLATLYVRLSSIRTADREYFQVKTSLSWYKTESVFMSSLLSPSPSANSENPLFPPQQPAGRSLEYSMSAFILEQMSTLESRLLDLLTETEIRAGDGLDVTAKEGSLERRGWTLIPRGWSARSRVAVAWVPVRGKALELVRQREALGARVLFAQMGMLGA
ncbi:hypothetical protein B7494_g7548 [Chlorociboria aeruginascens]|nr:hypothetical protein B7494_g7548 [Chlorociboria aeruginascens]